MPESLEEPRRQWLLVVLGLCEFVRPWCSRFSVCSAQASFTKLWTSFVFRTQVLYRFLRGTLQHPRRCKIEGDRSESDDCCVPIEVAHSRLASVAQGPGFTVGGAMSQTTNPKPKL